MKHFILMFLLCKNNFLCVGFEPRCAEYFLTFYLYNYLNKKDIIVNKRITGNAELKKFINLFSFSVFLLLFVSSSLLVLTFLSLATSLLLDSMECPKTGVKLSIFISL